MEMTTIMGPANSGHANCFVVKYSVPPPRSIAKPVNTPRYDKRRILFLFSAQPEMASLIPRMEVRNSSGAIAPDNCDGKSSGKVAPSNQQFVNWATMLTAFGFMVGMLGSGY